MNRMLHVHFVQISTSSHHPRIAYLSSPQRSSQRPSAIVARRSAAAICDYASDRARSSCAMRDSRCATESIAGCYRDPVSAPILPDRAFKRFCPSTHLASRACTIASSSSTLCCSSATACAAGTGSVVMVAPPVNGAYIYTGCTGSRPCVRWADSTTAGRQTSTRCTCPCIRLGGVVSEVDLS